MTKKIVLNVELTEDQAEAMAEFLKRLGWAEWREKAVSDEQAYEFKDACGVVQTALAGAGFSPR